MRYKIYLNLSSDSDIVNKLSQKMCILYFERTTLLEKTKRERNCFIISNESVNLNIILFSKEYFSLNKFTYMIYR